MGIQWRRPRFTFYIRRKLCYKIIYSFWTFWIIYQPRCCSNKVVAHSEKTKQIGWRIDR